MLFKEFGGVDAFPICLATKDTDEIVADGEGDRAGLRRDQPRGHLGAALLRDRGAAARRARHPRLPRRPARHRGRRAGRAASTRCRSSASELEDVRVVVTGVGAAGVAVDEDAARRRASATSSAATAQGASTRGRPGSHAVKAEYAAADEPARRCRGRPTRRSSGPTCSSALSAPGRGHGRRRSARWPTARSSSRWRTRRRRSLPEEIEGFAAVIGTGRSDYPNQINNVLAFPGIFRGALDVRAHRDHRGDEARRRARRSPRSSKPDELEAGLHDPERVQPGRRARRSPRRSRGRPRRAASPGAVGSSPAGLRRSEFLLTPPCRTAGA